MKLPAVLHNQKGNDIIHDFKIIQRIIMIGILQPDNDNRDSVKERKRLPDD